MTTRAFALSGVSCLALILLPAGPAEAQESGSGPGRRIPRGGGDAEPGAPETPAIAAAETHGGRTTRTASHVFETVLGPTWVHVYVSDRTGQPLSLQGIEGDGTLVVVRRTGGVPNRQSRQGRLLRVAADPRQGRARDYLEMAHQVGNEDPGSYELEAEIRGLSGEEHGRAQFSVTWSTAPAIVEYVCPATCAIAVVDPGECPRCEATLRRRMRSWTDDVDAPAPDPAEPARPARPDPGGRPGGRIRPGG